MSNLVAIDVEMVATGPYRNVEVPAKVAVVNSKGGVLMETFVQPRFRVTDYRSNFNGGITEEDLASGISYDLARQQVINFISGRILVGHDLQRDLGVFELTHNNTRDTATYPPFVERYGRGQKPSLRVLVEKELNRTMTNNHDPVEDAQMAMAVYMKYQW